MDVAQTERLNRKKPSKKEMGDAFQLLLSCLCHAGYPDSESARQAYEQVMSRSKLEGARFYDENACRAKNLNTAIDNLRNLRPPEKNKVITACVDAVSQDGKIEPVEAELLRAIGVSLEVPIPRLVV